MLRECGEGAEKEVEGVLEEYGKRWDGRIGCEGCRKGFDVGPGQVDIEEEKKGAEAGDGGLMYKLSVASHGTMSRGKFTSSSSSSRERRLNRRCL